MIDKVERSVSVGDGIIDVKNSIIRIIRVLAKYYWSARRAIASYSDDTQTSTLYPKTNRVHISGRDRQVSVPSTLFALFLQKFLMFWDFLSVYSCFHLRFFIGEFASSLLLFEERCSFENWYSGKGQILLDVEIVEKCSNKLGKESNLTHCTVGRGGGPIARH